MFRGVTEGPMVVAVEGLDGTGKSTLVRAMSRRLGALELRTPDPALATVRAVIDEDWHPTAARVWYAATVIEAGKRAALERLGGRSVVIDRYFGSTVAYASGAEERSVLRALEPAVEAVDLTLLLDAPDAIRCARIERRGAVAADVRSLEPKTALKVRTGYLEALARPWAGRVVRLDAGGSPGELVLQAERAVAGAYEERSAEAVRPTRAFASRHQEGRRT